jgi:hypothetical protein
MRKTKKMRSETKGLIVGGFLILVIWCLYINFIYVDYVGIDMDVCKEHMNASTKICNGIYTNFGGGLI